MEHQVEAQPVVAENVKLALQYDCDNLIKKIFYISNNIKIDGNKPRNNIQQHSQERNNHCDSLNMHVHITKY